MRYAKKLYLYNPYFFFLIFAPKLFQSLSATTVNKQSPKVTRVCNVWLLKKEFFMGYFFSFTRSGKGYIILFSASSEKVTRNPIFWDRPNSLGKSTSLD